MAYVKLDCGIVRSTLWIDREAREVFLTALLMAEPQVLDEPMPQLEVRALNPTGWVVPPGPYGFVDAAGVGIIRLAGIENDAGLAALERLGNPEPDSRSQAHEGRRLVRIDGGYLVLNFASYRDKDHTARERMKRFRERKKLSGVNAVTSRGNGVTSRVVTDSRKQNAEGIEHKEEEAAAFDTSECPRDMDAEAEHRRFLLWNAEKKQAPTKVRWSRWVSSAKQSGRYDKCKPRPPTEEEIQAERRRIIASQDS